MELQIISPLESQTYDIAWVELITDEGGFIIQKGHAPMVLILAHNKEITFRLKTGKEESRAFRQAIADITRTAVTIIANT